MSLNNPFLIPIAGIVGGVVMIIAVVAIVYWSKTRERELQVHQDLRLREMEHQKRMKELELEIEKTRAQQGAQKLG